MRVDFGLWEGWAHSYLLTDIDQNIELEGVKSYHYGFFLKVIVPEKSSVMLSQTKVEIKLRKEDIGNWPSLELKKSTQEISAKTEESK